jgi:D-alanyl-lipoteichoic acid acyltransferase DltB (MBOAT superfamily)
MLFTSGTFLFLYLPITLVGFFAISRFLGHSSGAAWLVAASLVFYGYWHPPHTLLLLASIAFNYVMGTFILGSRSRDLLSPRRLLIIAIATNLVLLGYFKYADFIIRTLNAVANLDLPPANVRLPIGISFFTFTQIAYLADVYVGKVRERRPIHYALFVTYFPHLIAGPVLHHAEMMPQFREAENYSPRLRSLTIGLLFLAIGLMKKVLFADSAAPIANSLFDTARTTLIPTAAAWRGILAYSLQIYFDFSGYSDMAVGLSRMIGVKLPYNFDSPYKSRSIIEFWRRWHITLSRFLRDYLYFALGGNRHGKFRRYVNLMTTMLLGGLWHGASWTFVVWGALHGVYLVVNHGWRFVCEQLQLTAVKLRWQLSGVITGVASRALTLGCVALAWILFRAETTQAAHNVIQSAIGLGSAPAGVADGPLNPVSAWLLAGLAVSIFCKNSQELIDDDLAQRLAHIGTIRRAELTYAFLAGAAIIAIAMLALISASRNVTEFIYFNF